MKRILLISSALFAITLTSAAQVNYQKTLVSTLRCQIAEAGAGLSAGGCIADEAAQAVQYLQAVRSDVLGNIIFTVSLPALEGQEYYDLNIKVRIGTRTYQIAVESLDRHVMTRPGQSARYDITWYNAFDQVPFVIGPFEATLEADFYSEDYACPNEAPVFDWRKQRPHLYLAAAGAVAIGVAELAIMKKADKDYQRYEDGIFGVTPGSSNEIPRTALDNARKTEDTANLISGVGIALVVGNAIIYAWRAIDIKKKRKDYEKYCGNTQPAITLAPNYDSTIAGSAIGMSLKVRF